MLSAQFIKRNLKFSFPAGTSRGVLHEKPSWYIRIWKTDSPEIVGIGECSPIWGLSPEKESEYEKILERTTSNINNFETLLSTELIPYPSIYFGLETALMDLFKGGKRIFFQNSFSEGKEGIKINGLVWMNTLDEMYKQALQKKSDGFTCIKLKIGSLNWDDELKLLKQLRSELGNEMILRVDANGAFEYTIAKEVLTQLKTLNIHSIEQPLKAGDLKLEQLCKDNIIPVALDEELIGWFDEPAKQKLISQIKPQYIVLKPSLHGGFMGCRQWITAAEKNNCGWWMTSALESNIGLNAIAQYTFQTKNNVHHGLGTGKIYSNNIASPLIVKGEKLWFDTNAKWEEL
jgi:o-succinylbenzoate synthase